MNTNTEKQKSVGALWSKVSKNGLKFLSGTIEINGVKTNVVVFKNNKKSSESAPDYSILESTPPSNSPVPARTPVADEIDDDIAF